MARDERFGTEPPGPGWTYKGELRWIRGDVAMTDNPKVPERGPRLAIVGGGPAGLFTAYLLNKLFPAAEVTLFEATDFLGGKLHTDRFDDGTLFEAGVAELYEYLGPGGRDALRQLIEEDLGLPTVNMKGGAVILDEKLVRTVDEVEGAFARATAENIRKFHDRVAELMPLAKYARRWQPDNSHPWADKTFHECIRQEIPDDPVAVCYIETAVHTDLATEPHTCNGLNGIKNVLMDNDKYMQLYHIRGGLDRIVCELKLKIDAYYRLHAVVTRIVSSGHSFTLHYVHGTEKEQEEFEAVIVAIPNHWLSQIRFDNPSLAQAIHTVIAHYDLPAHYLRVSLLFDEPFWDKHRIPGDFWMMDLYNGCCVYNESYRWVSTRGHVLSFLIPGQDALLQASENQDTVEIVERLVNRLPDLLRDDARRHLRDAQIDSYLGSVNAQPGGWPAEELRQEHYPDPQNNPGFFLVGDYFFDSTLNACLISAHTAVEYVLDYFDAPEPKREGFLKNLYSAGKSLSLTAS